MEVESFDIVILNVLFNTRKNAVQRSMQPLIVNGFN